MWSRQSSNRALNPAIFIKFPIQDASRPLVSGGTVGGRVGSLALTLSHSLTLARVRPLCVSHPMLIDRRGGRVAPCVGARTILPSFPRRRAGNHVQAGAVSIGLDIWLFEIVLQQI